jgi:hypothetical protein
LKLFTPLVDLSRCAIWCFEVLILHYLLYSACLPASELKPYTCFLSTMPYYPNELRVQVLTMWAMGAQPGIIASSLDLNVRKYGT